MSMLIGALKEVLVVSISEKREILASAQIAVTELVSAMFLACGKLRQVR